MTTHEPEITAPCNLALADGRTLDPAARGWSRHPVQIANQRGQWGRKKRWDYWHVQAGDLIVSGVVADIDLFGTSDIWWLDMSTMCSGGRGHGTPFGIGFDLPALAGSAPMHVRSKHYRCDMHDDAGHATHIEVRWTEKSGEQGEFDAVIEMPADHETLNVVIPWSDTRFQFTSKHQARPARGSLRVGDRSWTFGDDAWGVIDIGRGRWPYATRWNWGGGAGRATDGSVVGLQVGGKWTEGTGFTENGIVVDGRLSKIGRELEWHYSWDEPMAPWRVVDPGGQLDATLVPRFDKYGKLDLKVISRETHQVFGRWSGHVVDDSGRRLDFDGLQGFAEESRARW